jgi:hypothetical protein
MSEKAMAIATYVAASGGYVIMGVHNPVDGSDVVTHILSDVWEKKVGGKIEFVPDPDEIVQKRAGAHRQEARGAQAAGLRSPASGARAATGAWRSAAVPAARAAGRGTLRRRGGLKLGSSRGMPHERRKVQDCLLRVLGGFA